MMDDHERLGGVVRETAGFGVLDVGATETVGSLEAIEKLCQLRGPRHAKEPGSAVRELHPGAPAGWTTVVATRDFHVGRGSDLHPHWSEDVDQAGRNLGCNRPVDVESCLPWTESPFEAKRGRSFACRFDE